MRNELCNKTKIFLYYFQIILIKKIFCLIFLFLVFQKTGLQAQNIRIEVAPTSLAVNEPLTITIESEDKEIVQYSPFPDIAGLKRIKTGISKSETENTSQGKKRKVYLLEQIYHPIKVGVVDVPAFEMTVNNQKISSVGASIRIKPFDRLKGELKEPKIESTDNTPKIIEVKEDAFLAVEAGKANVYVGEGVGIILCFYIATNNKAPIQYIQINQQIEDIIKKLKPTHCWEESFNIKEAPEPPTVEIKGKSYYQHKFYESVLFPLNEQPINLPAVQLNMRIKRKISTKGNNNEFKEGEGEIVTFSTEPKMIEVMPLPAHPLREQVAVGKFFLEEGAPYRPIETGEGVNYYFKIVGEGNLAELHEPQTYNNNTQLAIYSPNRQSYILRKDNKISGSVVFEYLLMPQEAGKYNLRNHFEWIFFNLNTARYDTLRPFTQIQVSGKSYEGVGGQALKSHPLYSKMNQKITPISLKEQKSTLFWLNITIATLLLLACLTLLRFSRR